ncbi:MAG: GNAT family N-acetyltransferase [Salinibacterium sp.]|nr:MAG: GNAT family N-acetyltransferase [Salinibacterium sp.]
MGDLKRTFGDYEIRAYRRESDSYISVSANWLKTPLGQDDRIGSAEFWEREDDLFPEQVWVLEAHQRKGIATKMYELASEISGGKPVSNSDRQSSQGWAFRNRLGAVSATIIDQGSFSHALLAKAGSEAVTSSLNIEGTASTQPVGFEAYETAPCKLFKTPGQKVAPEHKRPPCQVQLTATEDGTSMAVRLCDDGKGTVAPVKSVDEAKQVIDRYCKCARNKPASTRVKCARKTVGLSGDRGELSTSVMEVYPPERLAPTMVKKYGNKEAAAAAAQQSAMNYPSGDVHRIYWESVHQLIRRGVH